MTMTNLLERLLNRRTERGASAVEYGLLIAGIAALIVVAVFALGPVVSEAFDDTCESIAGASGTTITTDCS
ncbi:Flp family type IVb pilin [Nocardioides sp. SOB77]|uniref:Flp family type IVb pilin n=1 Tax=Nocardioides oceani TaxID=3058369 RepID=A0ABT8FE60_9ACTN|nr:Flp family type IVb pilin [Nocardioides oceani]MDN4172968.1 Flp family type IVb pilin [Nocardioides oceani]